MNGTGQGEGADKDTGLGRRVPIQAGGPATGEEGPVFVCTTCGKKARRPGHLCAPVQGSGTYTCGRCGATADNPHHVCEPVAAEMRYVCGQCGRVSPVQGALCQPKEKDDRPERPARPLTP